VSGPIAVLGFGEAGSLIARDLVSVAVVAGVAATAEMLADLGVEPTMADDSRALHGRLAAGLS
jgi:hypothetical protein